ncbi:hypothetical protein BDK51DRAFT_38958, partial [Blyttiomyces helicus]
LKKPSQAADLYNQTADYFLAQGSPDRAAESLEKAARAVETTDLPRAFSLYSESCATYESEDRMRFGVETFKRAIALMIKNGRWEDAEAVSVRLGEAFVKLDQRPNFNKQALSTVVICLAAGNVGAANTRLDAFGAVGGFLQSEEGSIAINILEAFENGDEELLASTLKRQHLNFLDNEVTRTARTLKAPPRAQPPPARTDGGVGQPASEALKELQDELEEDGYC